MAKFSTGMTLKEIERELTKALVSSLEKISCKPMEAFECIRMLDSIIPSNLAKMLSLVENKYIPKQMVKEVAAIKCIIDLRLLFYKALAKQKQYKVYLNAATSLHKCLNK